MTPGQDQAAGGFDRSLLDEVSQTRGYQPIPDALAIGRCQDLRFFRERFIAHDNAAVVADVPDVRAAIVTGYGPTNPPTAGTLSAMLATRELQARTGLHTTIVISDLGAWNSRNLDWKRLEANRDRMIHFLRAIGFDDATTTLRTHQDQHNLVVSGRIAKLLDEDDFRHNKESLDELYQQLGLRGSMLGVMVDGLYTVADILNPLTNGCERVLMVSGIEEHYFVDLSKIVLSRAAERYPGDLFPTNAALGALFLGVIPGLGGYPKMSKSIPDSSIHLGEPGEDIRRKIEHAGDADDETIMKMVRLASGWTSQKVTEAATRFAARDDQPADWQEVKREYAATFLDYAQTWMKPER